MPDLAYIPASEIARILERSLPPTDRAALFAAACRINTLYMVGRAGSGHLGTSFSCVDLLAWLYLSELKDGDTFFSSKGHDVPALYSILIGLDRLPFEKIHQLRRLGGLPGHPDVGTPCIEANTGSLGMGVSKAKGFLKANRLLGKSGRVYVLTGDGELQEGQFWESLISAANLRLSDLTVIIDHNKIQSDTWVRRVSDLGDLEAKLRSFGWQVFRCNGNDIASFPSLFAKVHAVDNKPQIVIADTLKGKGVSVMESFGSDEKLYQFHSGAPDPAIYEQALNELTAQANAQLAAAGEGPLALVRVPRTPAASPTRPQRLIGAYAEALVAQGENNPRVVALDADLVKDCGVLPFAERFPDRFVECGIAEQDMVSQAGAMALRGLLPVVHSFACFLSTRPNEQIYNNATEHTKVIYVGSLTGLLPAAPGHSHQCVRDISALGGIPGLLMVEPASAAQVGQVVDYCFNHNSASSYIRLVTYPYDAPAEHPLPDRLELGVGNTIVEGKDAVAFAYGPVMLGELYKSAATLRRSRGIELQVVNLPWLNAIDSVWLRQTIAGKRYVFTVDNHYLHGGQGDMIARAVAELGMASVPVRRFGLTDIPRSGQPDEVLRAHALDADSLAAAMAVELDRL